MPFGPNRHAGWRRWAGAAFGMLWLLIPIADLAQSDPSPGHVALAAVGSVTFVAFYLGRAMRWPSLGSRDAASRSARWPWSRPC